MSGELINVLAKLTLLPTDESGRTSPILSGYRPNDNFSGSENRDMCMGELRLVYLDWLYPGQTAEVQIVFAASPVPPSPLSPGLQWRIQEGGTLVGIGTVVEMLNQRAEADLP